MRELDRFDTCHQAYSACGKYVRVPAPIGGGQYDHPSGSLLALKLNLQRNHLPSALQHGQWSNDVAGRLRASGIDL
jgi:hypothetical protein